MRVCPQKNGELSMIQELINVKELAKIIKVKRGTIYLWVNQKRIPYIKLGKRVLFNPKDINRWIKENTINEKMY